MSKFKREFKNVVYNYTDAEAKVREATSNDPWGPSSALMSELAEFTFHVQAYGLVMGMLWKRLNDHGKNWRHVYKSLVVLDYLIKSGSERVTVQCKENMFSIQTLKDFQYIDKDGKDQGANIREKAKGIVALLKDEEKLKDERKRALQARQRQTGLSSEQAAKQSPKNRNKVQFADGSKTTDGGSPSAPHRVEQDVEQARPTDLSEEDMQLKLALQLSKQQAEEDARIKNQEDESLQAAIELSKQDVGSGASPEEETSEQQSGGGNNLLLDFSETGLADPWTEAPAEPPPSYDSLGDPFANADPFGTPASTGDPFAPSSTSSGGDLFGPTSSVGATTSASSWNNTSVSPQPSGSLWSGGAGSSPSIPPAGTAAPPTSSVSNPFDLSTLGSDLPPLTTNASASKPRVEDSFLGADFGNLVDLDSLAIPPPILNNPNPFGGPATSPGTANPFEANKPTAPTLNQIATNTSGFNAPELLPAPLIPVGGGSPSQGSPIFPHTAPAARNQQPNPFS